MLVLSRKVGEKIYIDKEICITVVEIDNNKIRLGIEAPKNVIILREELIGKETSQVHQAIDVPAAHGD